MNKFNSAEGFLLAWHSWKNGKAGLMYSLSFRATTALDHTHLTHLPKGKHAINSIKISAKLTLGANKIIFDLLLGHAGISVANTDALVRVEINKFTEKLVYLWVRANIL